MHNGHKIYRVLCQVTDTKGYFILGREKAQQMNYIKHPKTTVVENKKRSSSQVEKDNPRQSNGKQPKSMSKLHKAGLI